MDSLMVVLAREADKGDLVAARALWDVLEERFARKVADGEAWVVEHGGGKAVACFSNKGRAERFAAFIRGANGYEWREVQVRFMPMNPDTEERMRRGETLWHVVADTSGHVYMCERQEGVVEELFVAGERRDGTIFLTWACWATSQEEAIKNMKDRITKMISKGEI